MPGKLQSAVFPGIIHISFIIKYFFISVDKGQEKITSSYITICLQTSVADPEGVRSNTPLSGLEKDLDQWVFHPLLFNLMSISLPT